MEANRLSNPLLRPLLQLGAAQNIRYDWKMLSRGIIGCSALLTIALAAIACGNSAPTQQANPSPTGTPSLQILAPGDQEEITGDSVELRVAVNGFIMDASSIGMPAEAGRGHWHLYLNGELVSPSATDSFLLKPLRPGSHHLRIALANNDHSTLSPPVEESIVISVVPTDAADSAAAQVGPAMPSDYDY